MCSLYVFVFFFCCKTFLSLVVIDVSVSNPLNCEVEERLNIIVVAFEMFVLNVLTLTIMKKIKHKKHGVSKLSRHVKMKTSLW